MKSDRKIPPELAAALKTNCPARAIFDAMPPSHRAEYCRYVDEAKKAETRQRRAARSMQMICDWDSQRTERAIRSTRFKK